MNVFCYIKVKYKIKYKFNMYILESYPFYVFNALIYSFLCFLFLKKVIQKIYFYSFYMHGNFSKMGIA
jgi:hypothetical protein